MAGTPSPSQAAPAIHDTAGFCLIDSRIAKRRPRGTMSFILASSKNQGMCFSFIAGR